MTHYQAWRSRIKKAKNNSFKVRAIYDSRRITHQSTFILSSLYRAAIVTKLRDVWVKCISKCIRLHSMAVSQALVTCFEIELWISDVPYEFPSLSCSLTSNAVLARCRTCLGCRTRHRHCVECVRLQSKANMFKMHLVCQVHCFACTFDMW